MRAGTARSSSGAADDELAATGSTWSGAIDSTGDGSGDLTRSPRSSWWIDSIGSTTAGPAGAWATPTAVMVRGDIASRAPVETIMSPSTASGPMATVTGS